MTVGPAEVGTRPRRRGHRLGPARPRWSSVGVHAVLFAYTVLAVGPVLLIFMNSFKERTAIFEAPFRVPTPSTFTTKGYETVKEVGDFGTYFTNSLVVTIVAVLLVLTLSALAAYGLTEYRFPGNLALALFFALGIMIPIRLGTVSIQQITNSFGLLDGTGPLSYVLPSEFWDRWSPLVALILVYTAMGIPLGVFLLSQFQRQVPNELKNAARIDGAGEGRVFWLTVPLIRPGLAAVAVFTMLPVWNDLWFPLILAPGSEHKTVTLGAQQFLGQYQQNWEAVLASLSLAALPVILLYVIFSRQFLRGLTQGAIK